MRLARFTEFGKKIICVGRNYKLHVKEMKYSLPTTTPIVFLKPRMFFANKNLSFSKTGFLFPQKKLQQPLM